MKKPPNQIEKKHSNKANRWIYMYVSDQSVETLWCVFNMKNPVTNHFYVCNQIAHATSLHLIIVLVLR